MQRGNIEGHRSLVPLLRMAAASVSQMSDCASFPELKSYISYALNVAHLRGLWSVHRDLFSHIMSRSLTAMNVETRRDRKAALFQVKERAEDLLCSEHKSFNLSELVDIASILSRGDDCDLE